MWGPGRVILYMGDIVVCTTGDRNASVEVKIVMKGER